MSHSAQFTALQDQLQMATRESEKLLEHHVTMADGKPYYGALGPFLTKCMDRLEKRLQENPSEFFCSHIKPTAPALGIWVPWKPGRVRCPKCAFSRIDVRGTVENNTCDRCRRKTRTIHPNICRFPGRIFTFERWGHVALPPLTVMYGLCPTCQKTEFPFPNKERD